MPLKVVTWWPLLHLLNLWDCILLLYYTYDCFYEFTNFYWIRRPRLSLNLHLYFIFIFATSVQLIIVWHFTFFRLVVIINIWRRFKFNREMRIYLLLAVGYNTWFIWKLFLFKQEISQLTKICQCRLRERFWKLRIIEIYWGICRTISHWRFTFDCMSILLLLRLIIFKLIKTLGHKFTYKR